MIIVDTGPVVAMANSRDKHHSQCVDLLTQTVEPLILPEPLLTEIGYMLGSRAATEPCRGIHPAAVSQAMPDARIWLFINTSVSVY